MSLYQWWAETLGREGTIHLAAILSAGIGIVYASFKLGVCCERDRADRRSQQRQLWREQDLLK